MEIGEILRYVLLTVGALALIALVVVLIELARTLKAARITVVDLKKQIDPTLEHVNNITAALEPTLAKVDPLVDRVSLTVDAANLEIMRLDTIMSDLGDISGSLNSAVEAVDTIANAPLNLVSKASSKIGGVLGGSKAASDDSVALGAAKKATPAPALEEPAVPPEEKIAQVAKIARTVKEGYTTIVNGGGVVAAAQSVAAGIKEAQEEAAEAAEEAAEKAAEAAADAVEEAVAEAAEEVVEAIDAVAEEPKA